MKHRTLSYVCLFVLLICGCLTVRPQSVFDTMSGRVTDSVSGYGVRYARITVSAPAGCSDWSGIATTSTFGYYALEVPVDCNLIVVPSQTYHTFTPSSRFISLGMGITDIDFIRN